MEAVLIYIISTPVTEVSATQTLPKNGHWTSISYLLLLDLNHPNH